MTYQEMAQVMPFKDLVTKNAAELIKLYGGDRKKVLQHCALLRTMSVYLMNEENHGHISGGTESGNCGAVGGSDHKQSSRQHYIQ